jgi:hypothetical protein
MGDEWDESKHPRDARGEFSSGGEGGLKAWARAKGPAPMQEGTHFRELFTKGVTKGAVHAIQAALVRNPLAKAALEAHPLGVLTIRNVAPNLEADGVAARYQPRADGRGALIVQTEPKSLHKLGRGVIGSDVPHGYGRPDQQPYSVSTLAPTHREYIERNAVHEFGHHFHGGDEKRDGYNPEIDRVVKEAFEKAKPVTEYAKTNREEYFAETFAAHTYHPAELKERDPVGHAMVEKVLKMRARAA